jgi:hypothetical protein
MTPADEYRVKAGNLAALARSETDPFGKSEYERLSLAYLLLAEQAERNSWNDVVWNEKSHRPEQQQQPQPEPRKDE